MVFQVAVSVTLLGGTSLFLQMLRESRTVRSGLAIEGVAMLETDTRYAGYSWMPTPATRSDEIRRRIAASPGVQSRGPRLGACRWSGRASR